MLFSEVYGSYYNVIAAILTQAVADELTDGRINNIVREAAFGESVLTIPAALRSEAWPLLTPQNATPLAHAPTMGRGWQIFSSRRSGPAGPRFPAAASDPGRFCRISALFPTFRRFWAKFP